MRDERKRAVAGGRGNLNRQTKTSWHWRATEMDGAMQGSTAVCSAQRALLGNCGPQTQDPSPPIQAPPPNRSGALQPRAVFIEKRRHGRAIDVMRARE